MKPIFNTILFASLLILIMSGCEEHHTISNAPIPTLSDYPGVMEVRKTDGHFAKTEIPRTTLEAGDYKIIVFPKQLELKSYYVKADSQGNIEVEYKLNEEIAVESGYDGTVFGILQIINETRSGILNVPVGYLP